MKAPGYVSCILTFLAFSVYLIALQHSLLNPFPWWETLRPGPLVLPIILAGVLVPVSYICILCIAVYMADLRCTQWGLWRLPQVYHSRTKVDPMQVRLL